MATKSTVRTQNALSVNEIADLWGVSRYSIYQAVYEGRLDAFRIGAHIRVTPEALDKFVQEHPFKGRIPGRGRKKAKRRKKRTAS